MPKLAAFPKGFIKQLVAGEMSIYEWIKLGDELNVDGLEFYNNFADVKDEKMQHFASKRQKKRFAQLR